MRLAAAASAVFRKQAASWRHAADRFFREVTRRLAPKYRLVVVQDVLPGELKRHRLYVVEDDGFEEQAAMLCPCGCKRILHMNLLTDERPCWTLTRNRDGTASLSPSVWRKKDCGSHFWLRHGRVEWARG